MTTTFHKFPSTPHLDWLATKPIREDKLMTPADRTLFLGNKPFVEEKIDGANLGLSFSPEGQLRFQNRGNWLTTPFQGQWKRLSSWAATHEQSLREHLSPGLILFGEWCYAQHSICYTNLPDWFIVFDIYDESAGRFWSRKRRDLLVKKCALPLVPEIPLTQAPSLALLKTLLSETSDFGTEQREGLYLRVDKGDWLEQRAKLVNPEFTQHIEQHWSKSGIVANQLSTPLSPT